MFILVHDISSDMHLCIFILFFSLFPLWYMHRLVVGRRLASILGWYAQGYEYDYTLFLRCLANTPHLCTIVISSGSVLIVCRQQYGKDPV